MPAADSSAVGYNPVGGTAGMVRQRHPKAHVRRVAGPRGRSRSDMAKLARRLAVASAGNLDGERMVPVSPCRTGTPARIMGTQDDDLRIAPANRGGFLDDVPQRGHV